MNEMNHKDLFSFNLLALNNNRVRSALGNFHFCDTSCVLKIFSATIDPDTIIGMDNRVIGFVHEERGELINRGEITLFAINDLGSLGRV